MSDYEVSLVNDNMQEFYVRFYGPPESMCSSVIASLTEISLSFDSDQRLSPEGYGKFMSSSQISTLSSLLA